MGRVGDEVQARWQPQATGLHVTSHGWLEPLWHPRRVEAEQSGEAGRVLAAAHRRATALAERDPATLLKLLHPRLRWTTYRGDVLNRDQYVAGNTSGTLVWHDQRLDDVHIIVVGGTAVLIAVATDTVERDGQPQSFRLRLTQTWVQTEDGWCCLAGHAGPQV